MPPRRSSRWSGSSTDGPSGVRHAAPRPGTPVRGPLSYPVVCRATVVRRAVPYHAVPRRTPHRSPADSSAGLLWWTGQPRGPSGGARPARPGTRTAGRRLTEPPKRRGDRGGGDRGRAGLPSLMPEGDRRSPYHRTGSRAAAVPWKSLPPATPHESRWQGRLLAVVLGGSRAAATPGRDRTGVSAATTRSGWGPAGQLRPDRVLVPRGPFRPDTVGPAPPRPARVCSGPLRSGRVRSDRVARQPLDGAQQRRVVEPAVALRPQ